MKTIWKFPLTAYSNGPFEIEMPSRAKVLFVGMDPKLDDICIWAEVESLNPKVIRKGRVHATGEDWVASFEGKFIGGVITKEGFVWHVYFEDEAQ